MSHRTELQSALRQYPSNLPSFQDLFPNFGNGQEVVQKFVTFIASEPQCFERSLATGHITGSALVTNKSMNRVLLTLHAKLGMWLQLGGHADGQHLVHDVAAREVEEEHGVKLETMNRHHPVDSLIVAVAHQAFVDLSPIALRQLCARDGQPVIADLKSIYEVDALQKLGCEVFRL